MHDQIIGLISESLGIPSSLIEPDSDLYDDLGADSIAVVEVILMAEDEFRINVPEHSGIRTVAELIGVIEKAGVAA